MLNISFSNKTQYLRKFSNFFYFTGSHRFNAFRFGSNLVQPINNGAALHYSCSRTMETWCKKKKGKGRGRPYLHYSRYRPVETWCERRRRRKRRAGWIFPLCFCKASHYLQCCNTVATKVARSYLGRPCISNAVKGGVFEQ